MLRGARWSKASANLLRLLEFLTAGADLRVKYSDDEPRDDHGRWTDGGGGDAPAASLVAGQEAPATAEGRSALADKIVAEQGATAAVAAAKDKVAGLDGYQTASPVEKGGFIRSDGTYTPERAALHRDIVGRLFNDQAIVAATPPEGTAPVATILGGRGGSGKSWLTGAAGPIDASKTIIVNADDFKAALPEYQGWNAPALHEESDHLTNMASDQAVVLGVNVTHDATLRSDTGISAKVARYEAAGYNIEGHYMFAAPAVAAGRAVDRFVRGGATGRFVPPEVVLGNVNNEKNFDSLIPHFSRWTVYDNSGGRGSVPKLVAQGGSAG